MLSTLRGTNRIDCLNKLAYEYNFQTIHSDSALKYARQAYTESSAINYVSGKGISLIRQAETQGRLLGKIDRMDALSREAIKVLKYTKDPSNLSHAHRELALALLWQGRGDTGRVVAKTAIQIASTANDTRGVGWSNLTLGVGYVKTGEYWLGFEKLIEAQRIGKSIKDSMLAGLSLALIGRAFGSAGEPREALNYYFESLRYVSASYFLLFPHVEEIGSEYYHLKKYDSAVFYQQLHRRQVDSITTDVAVRKRANAWNLPDFSMDLQIQEKKYDVLLERIQSAEKTSDVLSFMHSLFYLSKAYEGKRDYKKAIRYSHQLLQQAKANSFKHYKKEGYHTLAVAYDELNKNDSALFYFKQYVAIKDTIEKQQFTLKAALFAAASESENKIRLLRKDQQIKQHQLNLTMQEMQTQSQLKNGLLVGLCFLLLLSVLIYRNIALKRKNEKLDYDKVQHALKTKALELEMQALRAQMNPHFIFNCLSAIDNLIQTNQPDKATNCLSRFAKLIRNVLDSSKNNLVPFQKDYQTLQLYLELEQFRCNDKFSYELMADDELLQGDYRVPPLIIQPFIENAIHHGLLNKQVGDRRLKVNAELKDEHIVYSITDNGIGRREAAVLKQLNRPGQQSYGIEITRDRIHLHNKKEILGDMLITDLETDGIPNGTRACVRINCFQ